MSIFKKYKYFSSFGSKWWKTQLKQFNRTRAYMFCYRTSPRWLLSYRNTSRRSIHIVNKSIPTIIDFCIWPPFYVSASATIVVPFPQFRSKSYFYVVRLLSNGTDARMKIQHSWFFLERPLVLPNINFLVRSFFEVFSFFSRNISFRLNKMVKFCKNILKTSHFLKEILTFISSSISFQLWCLK